MSHSTRIGLAAIHWDVSHSRLGRLAGALLTTSCLITAASAQDATWRASPPTDSYSSASNWNPTTVPTGTATFDASNTTTITNVTGTVQQWNFSATASNYALNVTGAFSFTGAGITVGNGQQQINANSGAQLNFRNSSSAGSLSAATASVSMTVNSGGNVAFHDTSTSGAASINVQNGGNVRFLDSSSGPTGSGTINNQGGTVTWENNSSSGNLLLQNSGNMFWRDNSTAGTNTIITSGFVAFAESSRAGSATISISATGSLGFSDNSSAENAHITSSGSIGFSGSARAGNAQITSQGTLSFRDTTSADHASILNGGSVAGGSRVIFTDSSTAGNATITRDSSSAVDTRVDFFDTSSAGSATIDATRTTATRSTVSFNQSATAGNATITANGNVQFVDNSSAGNATINVSRFDTSSVTSFADNATAANAHINSNGEGIAFFDASSGGSATISLTGGGSVQFQATSTAGSATITAQTGAISFSGTTTAASSHLILADALSSLSFLANSTAANAVIDNAGRVTFSGNATGGNAAITNIGNATTNFSSSTGPASNGALTAGSIAGSGTFTIGTRSLTVGGNNASTEVTGVIAGTTGTLTKVGAGTLILSGINTYTGVTTISAGTLQLGNGGTTGSILGDLIDNGIFAVNRSDSYQFDSAISGTGTLRQNGTGMTILTAANTYGGGTTINAGTLQLGNGGTSGSILGNVLDNGILAINRSNTYQFDGVISGTGALQQTGPGTTILTATSTYGGATTVNAGTLAVNGSIASSSGVDVNNGGTLGGTGTLATTRINAGGTLSPGNSIGTITVAGGLTFVGAGNYVVEVSPTAADRTNVTGGANLAGTIRIVPTGGTYVLGTRYVVLNATSGVTGTFGTVDFAGGAPFRPTVTYDANNVFLTLDPGAISPFLQGATVNQRNVATGLDGSFQRAIPPAQFLGLFGLQGTSLGGALNQLSGEIATGAATAGFQDMGQFLSLMLDPFLENRSGGSAAGFDGPALSFAQERAETDRLPDAMSAYARMVTKAPPTARYEPRWTTWGAAYGASGSFDGNATVGSHDLTVRNGGFAGGIDYRLSPNSVIGVSATGSTLSYGLDSGLGSGRGEAFKAGVYASTRFDNAYLSASAAYGRYDLSTTRNVFLPGFGERLTGDVDADSFAGRIEAGYRFGFGLSSGITPYAAFQAQSFRTDGYSELGSLGAGGLALTYGSRTFDETRGELGARFDSRLAVNGNSVFLLRGRVAWAREFSGDPSIAAAFQALPGAGFTVTGTGFAQDALLVSIGPEIRFAGGWSLRAKFDGEFSDRTQVYAGTGTVRFTW